MKEPTAFPTDIMQLGLTKREYAAIHIYAGLVVRSGFLMQSQLNCQQHRATAIREADRLFDDLQKTQAERHKKSQQDKRDLINPPK